jgi:hypothetical protein
MFYFVHEENRLVLTVKLWKYVREVTDQNLDHFKGLLLPRITG